MHSRATTAKIEPPAIPGMECAGVVHRTAGPLVVSSVLCALAALGVGAGTTLIHGGGGLMAPAALSLRDGSLLALAVGALVGVGLCHEIAHALAARWIAGLPWRRIGWGVSVRHLGVYCRIGGRVHVRDHRRIGLAPALGVALPLALVSLIWGGDLGLIAAVVALLTLPQDLASLWQFRTF
ncbi:MAG: hypothetical protein QGH45_17455, partial [Myxococcota bacterium]|nr:hypothetical protein [Myxococcota bacterium]